MALTGPGWLGAHLLRQVTRSVGRGERVRPCRKQPNLGTEGLACLAVERREHLGLCCPQLVIQGREELDAELRRDDSARPPVAGIGTTLDQLGRLEIVEEVSHDRSIDSEVLGEGKLARHRALSRGGKDLVAPGIAVPIGPNGGAGQFPGQVEIAGPEAIAEMKGREMGVGRLRERFGLVPETRAGVADDRVDVQPEIEAMLNK